VFVGITVIFVEESL